MTDQHHPSYTVDIPQCTVAPVDQQVREEPIMAQQDDVIHRVVTALVETAEVMAQAARTLREVSADLAAQVAVIKELGS